MKEDKGAMWREATSETSFACCMLENPLLCNFTQGESADGLFIPSTGRISSPWRTGVLVNQATRLQAEDLHVSD